MNRGDLKPMIMAALASKGGTASVVEVAKHIWDNHNEEILADSKLMYTWQYDIRWAALSLKLDGAILLGNPRKGFWKIA